MTDDLRKTAQKEARPIPRRLVISVVCILCLCILGSTLFTFVTLSRFRTLYLSNRGHSIAEALESQTRGPGRRHNTAFWQSLLEDNYAVYSDSVAFLALIDQKGKILAGKGSNEIENLEYAGEGDAGIFIFEQSLSRSRNPRGEANPVVAGWRIRMGLYSSDADFIKRLAFSQLAVSALAILALIVLSIHLLRTLDRFIEMKAREGAEAQLKSIGTMAASLAHEIRNPLGTMKGLTQLAQEDLPPDDEAQARLRTVVGEAERLERLVTNLLDFARPKEPQICELDLNNLLSDVKTMVQPRLEAANVSLQILTDQHSLSIQSDPSGLRQVLLNVIFNAADASASGGKIVLESVRVEDGKSVVIRIDDSGPGLAGRDPDELFQPFVTTKSQGTGLGLAVSRQIMEGLGGELKLEDLPQGGARCTLRLPLNKA
ncbi:MAG: hypothetical protein JXA73_08305 [Acidobacteria bacterium]|nr:hypothetical protein [Acidobacteriota bacterium]